MPGITTSFGPNLSSSLPEIGIMIAAATACGNINRPVSSAPRPRTFCKNSGSSNNDENIAIVATNITVVAMVNVLSFRTLKSSSGCSCDNSTTIQQGSAVAAISSMITTCGALQP